MLVCQYLLILCCWTRHFVFMKIVLVYLCHDAKQLLEISKKILNCVFLTYLRSQQHNKKTFPKFLHLLMMMMMMMMMMMIIVSVVWLTDERRSPISNRDHCQRSSPSRISNTPRAGFEPARNLSSGFDEWSCEIVITTTPLRCLWFIMQLCFVCETTWGL